MNKISPPLQKFIGFAAIAMLAVLVLTYFFGSWILEFLFRDRAEFSRSDAFIYLGLTMSGIVLLGGGVIGGQRLYWQKKNHRKLTHNDFNARFKNASTLLNKEETNLTLAGISSLHQIAIEAFSEAKNQRYAAVIKNLLCSFLRKNSESPEAEEGKTTAITRKKPEAVFQMVVDLLFRSSDSTIYNEPQTDLTRIALASLDFRKAVLRKAQLCGVDLSRTDLSGADLSRADLGRANLAEANFVGANLSESRLSGALLNRSDLSGANLYRATLHRTTLHEANLSEANLKNAFLKRASLNEANLSNANLSEANLIETHLKRTDLSEANLTKSDLMGAQLNQANLSGANLNQANLSGAKLINADLSKTKLIGTTLWFADLSEANLEYTDFSKALINETTLFTGTIHAGKTLEHIRAYIPPVKK